MCGENQTAVTAFYFLGFQNIQQVKDLLFILLLMLYIAIITENVLIILLVSVSHNLHHPMYFFLKNLSITDILSTSNVVPKLLFVIMNEGGTISPSLCIFQYYFHCLTGFAQSFILTVMSLDRYIAICIPLRYASIMTTKNCIYLVCFCWTLAFYLISSEIIFMYFLQFCESNVIDHFFCDIAPILELAVDPLTIVWHDFVVSLITVFVPFLLVIVSYFCIFIAILKMSSNRSRHKAFSTCSSHLFVVSMYYGSLGTIYLLPSKGTNENKLKSLLYIVMTPFINPIIYSLRSREIIEAIKNIIHSVKTQVSGLTSCKQTLAAILLNREV